MKRYLLAAQLTLTTTAYAGYGGMGNVDDGDGGPVDLGGMVLFALFIWLCYWLWKKYF